ncbi:hypothetical protein L0156_10895 [bacterium]|nr:hypothetical protein [bacterium]
MNHELRNQLLRLIEEDERVREELATDGSLFEGYHQRMEAVHRKNAAQLRTIIQEHGWPGLDLVGKDGEEAAWRIAQHSIGEPEFMRNTLELLGTAIKNQQAPLWQLAYLEDRIRLFEGKEQLYGTSVDWDEHGHMSPFPAIKDAEHVNERRATMGLPPLKKSAYIPPDEKPPADLKARRLQMDEWARSVGWRK